MNPVQRIIHGGGWKNIQEHRIKVKAWVGVMLTIAAAGGGPHFYEDYGILAFLPSGIFLLVTILLFWFERQWHILMGSAASMTCASFTVEVKDV